MARGDTSNAATATSERIAPEGAGDLPTRFDLACAVAARGQGRYTADLDAGWRVGGAINGGYVLATVGHALRAAIPAKPDPITISGYYLTAATAGPADVDVRILRDGGSNATVAADLHQVGEIRASILATFGDLAKDALDVRTTAREIELPPPDECISSTMAPESFLENAPLMSQIELRFDPDHVGWALGTPDDSDALSAWFRFEDDRDPDPLSLLFVVDALPPVAVTRGHFGWAPTIELTAHVRARPAPGWLKVSQSSRNIAGGLFEEDCEVWDSTGRLVAQSRQLARFPTTLP